ncbi:MAG: nitrous oxide reductase [Saprospirales bacterium]|nr:MAG: nitrous oxide reductase [Saprospirales bacterium]
MKPLFFLMAMALFIIGCTVEPRPINFGHDDCELCKMKLMDERFGAQLVTDKGRIFMFDDVNCMVMFLDSEEGKRHNYSYELIVDFSNPGELLDVHYTYFLQTPEVRTPMNSEIIALPNEEKANELRSEMNGIRLVWGEVLTKYK